MTYEELFDKILDKFDDARADLVEVSIAIDRREDYDWLYELQDWVNEKIAMVEEQSTLDDFGD